MKVGFVGLGSIGLKHAQVIKEQYPQAELFALRSNVNAIAYPNIANIFSYEDIPSEIDFFIISSPTSTHKDVLSKLLIFNRPLFIEKPLFSEVSQENEKLLEEIRKREITTYVGYSLRHHPCIKFLKEKINTDTQRINEVNIYCGSYLPHWRPGKDFRTVYSSVPELGGGVHLDLSHEIDYAYYILGKPQNIFSHFRSQSSLQIPVIDYANYSLDYEGFTANIILNYYRIKPKREIEILFDDDIWRVDLINSTISNVKGEVIFSEKTDQMSMLKNQMKYFVDAFKNDLFIDNDVFEAYEVLKICLHDAKR